MQSSDKTEHWIDAALDKLRSLHLDRHLVPYPKSGGKMRLGDREVLNLSSNDYLDLAHHPRVVTAAEEALRGAGAGSAASRLVTGTLPLHQRLEERLAAYKGYPAALLFGSGYMANAGTIPSIVGRGDLVFADRLVHASVLDAITLSRARLIRFKHNDAGHLDELLERHPASGRRLVVTESLFSMDGDLAPLPGIAEQARKHQAILMVDEAHATGVFGPGGRGLVNHHDLTGEVNLSMGTLSKALGGYGGFIASSERMRDLLIHRARAFVYTTAPPPAAVGAALGALDVLRDEPHLGLELLQRADRFRQQLQEGGLDTMASAGQIIPVRVGDNQRALDMAAALRNEGLIVVAIRPPTVPESTARLRLSVTLAHTDEDLERAANLVLAKSPPGLRA